VLGGGPKKRPPHKKIHQGGPAGPDSDYSSRKNEIKLEVNTRQSALASAGRLKGRTGVELYPDRKWTNCGKHRKTKGIFTGAMVISYVLRRKNRDQGYSCVGGAWGKWNVKAPLGRWGRKTNTPCGGLNRAAKTREFSRRPQTYTHSRRVSDATWQSGENIADKAKQN